MPGSRTGSTSATRSPDELVAVDLKEVESGLTRVNEHSAAVHQEGRYERLLEQDLAQLGGFLSGLLQRLLDRDVTQPTRHPLGGPVLSAEDDPPVADRDVATVAAAEAILAAKDGVVAQRLIVLGDHPRQVLRMDAREPLFHDGGHGLLRDGEEFPHPRRDDRSRRDVPHIPDREVRLDDPAEHRVGDDGGDLHVWVATRETGCDQMQGQAAELQGPGQQTVAVARRRGLDTIAIRLDDRAVAVEREGWGTPPPERGPQSAHDSRVFSEAHRVSCRRRAPSVASSAFLPTDLHFEPPLRPAHCLRLPRCATAVNRGRCCTE